MARADLRAGLRGQYRDTSAQDEPGERIKKRDQPGAGGRTVGAKDQAIVSTEDQSVCSSQWRNSLPRLQPKSEGDLAVRARADGGGQLNQQQKTLEKPDRRHPDRGPANE